MNHRHFIGTAAVALVAVVPSAASAKTIAAASARGEEPIATAAGEILRPKVVRVHVDSSTFRQRVWVGWSMTCKRRRGGDSRTTSDTFKGRTPLTRRLTLPYRRAQKCIVAATVELQGNGRVRVRLSGTSYPRR